MRQEVHEIFINTELTQQNVTPEYSTKLSSQEIPASPSDQSPPERNKKSNKKKAPIIPKRKT